MRMRRTPAQAPSTPARAPRTPAQALSTAAQALRTPSLLLAAALVLLTACASGPPPTDWQLNAQLALKNFEAAYLEGNTRVAAAEFARARAALSATGRADLLARAELVRCAVRVASLEFDECPGYLALEADAGAAERAYAAFLAGRWTGLDAGLLPAQHRAVIAAGALPATAEPLSQLVAAGALLHVARIAPADISAAVETASQNGWRRPLLAWLGVQAKRAAEAGDAEALARLRRRIGLVEGAQVKP